LIAGINARTCEDAESDGVAEGQRAIGKRSATRDGNGDRDSAGLLRLGYLFAAPASTAARNDAAAAPPWAGEPLPEGSVDDGV
jgi:hypothetical protein